MEWDFGNAKLYSSHYLTSFEIGSDMYLTQEAGWLGGINSLPQVITIM